MLIYTDPSSGLRDHGEKTNKPPSTLSWNECKVAWFCTKWPKYRVKISCY